MMDLNRAESIKKVLKGRFPSQVKTDEGKDKPNPAIQLYGLRLYKDQTPVEYLAELLLVFVSPKGSNKENPFSFQLPSHEGASYWPEDRIAMKLFSFFPSSKLETRHPVHQAAYLGALKALRERIEGPDDEKDETVRLLQSLFGGFVGVAKNRTWVTHSFLPASTTLLSRELAWLHSAAMKDSELKEWGDNHNAKHFARDRHIFMARGGELLFLQLAHLFSDGSSEALVSIQSEASYKHLAGVGINSLRESIETGMRSILEGAVGQVNELTNFIEGALDEYRLEEEAKKASLGWVPSSSLPEAFLFANEIKNICDSALGDLEKLELLQLLCSTHVLRSLCFQAQRIDKQELKTDGFAGNYAWVTAGLGAKNGSASRKLAQNSFEGIEDMLYRVLRLVDEATGGETQKFSEADKHGFQIFRKIAKEIGLVVPRTGRGQRFVLPPLFIRLLVAALVKPGERVRLTEFFDRVFAHFGIALGDRQLAKAMAWGNKESGPQDYAVAANSTWIEDALKQGGFLVELSDAVSIVHNPGSMEHRA